MITDPTRWQRVQELCHAALERALPERPGFLTAACGGDDELRREVEALIVHDLDADQFLSASTFRAVAHAAVGDSPASLIGSRFGVYEILSRIGAGGMGEVYRARDTKLHREVAIKVLSDVFVVDPERLARFQREALVLASLNHPHIAAIYGVEESAHALVLELVDGLTLTERIAEGRMPVPETCSVASQIAGALEAAHERGIVHRDLKPANVKIRPDGAVKVLDFGLAKATADDGRSPTGSPTITVGSTRNGAILGTAAYMAPEQARGRAVDKRADIWAFGCVVYEMLTGRPAFDGETASDTIAAILSREPDWKLLPNGTPETIRRLLRRCVEKDPRRRLRDIADARLEIDDALAGAAEAGDPAATRSAVGRDIEFQRLTDFVGLKQSPAVSPDGKMVAFVALVGGRRQISLRLLAGGPPLQVTHDDVDHEQPRWAPDSSTLVYYTPTVRSGAGGALWEIAALGGPSRRIASTVAGGDVSHDGRRVALFQSSDAAIELVTVARDGSHPNVVAHLPPRYLYSTPRWSPNDRFLAFHRDTDDTFTNYLEVVPAAGGQVREIARSEWLAGFSWLPDGERLVYSSSRGSTMLYSPAFGLRTVGRDGGHDCQLTYGDVSFTEPDVHASGKILSSRVRSQSDIWKFPVTGTPVQNTANALRVTRQTGHVQTPSVSPDGSEIVYLSDNGGHGNLWIANVDRSGARQITYERDPAVSVGVPMWSPAGDWIVFIVAYGRRSTLWVIRPDGSGLRELVPNGWGACWSNNGAWVWYTSRRNGRPCLEKISIDGGEPVVVRSEPVWTAAVTGDGAVVYYVCGPSADLPGIVGDFDVHRVRSAGGPSERIGRISGSRVPVSPRLLQLFLSPDAQWLAVPLVDGVTSNLWAFPSNGGPPKQLTDFDGRSIVIARSVSWSADSRFLYAAVAETETDIVLVDGLIC